MGDRCCPQWMGSTTPFGTGTVECRKGIFTAADGSFVSCWLIFYRIININTLFIGSFMSHYMPFVEDVE